MPGLKLTVDFGGGAELLVGKVKRHEVDLQGQEDAGYSLGQLLGWIRDNLLKERPELFLKDPQAPKLDVRPGILVLVNDADWELLGQTDYVLEDGDNVTFISTLHGG